MTDGSSHADYIYARDKKFKENLNSTKVSQRIVPEVSGKKRLLETSFDTELPLNKEENNEKNVKKVTFQDEKKEEEEDKNISFEKILIILKNSENTLNNDQKKECIRILNCKESNLLLITTCILFAAIFVLIISQKHKSSRID